jgi:hypothetical protein
MIRWLDMVASTELAANAAISSASRRPVQAHVFFRLKPSFVNKNLTPDRRRRRSGFCHAFSLQISYCFDFRPRDQAVYKLIQKSRDHD